MPSRRHVLQAMGLGAASLLLPRRGYASSFGAFPGSSLPRLPEPRCVRNVLEVYLYGGLSPWESFYFVPGRGKRDRRFIHAFDGTENGAALTACRRDAERSLPFAKDASGVDVHLGPFAQALFARPDLIDRMRVVVQRHDLLPHEAAVPAGISGKSVGSPTLTCLGAHVQRAFLTRAQREVPYSYVLMNAGAVPSDNTDAFVATGLHPGSARPLRLNVDDAARLKTLLDRPAVEASQRDAFDAYVASRARDFESRLRHDEGESPLRSKALRELTASIASVRHAGSVKRLLPDALLTPPNTQLCAGEETGNYPLGSLRLATHLLTHEKNPARYVCVLDSGLVAASGGGGYDTHSGGEQIVQLTNLENLLSALASVINAPGEQDKKKLDLDDTLVILNTEFGRTPELQPDAGGRNHHPNGYVTVFLGGPVQGRSIAGAIDDQGQGSEAISQAENRIAALLALGLFPFSPEGFSLSDVRGARSESEAVRTALSRVLGTSPTGEQS